MNRGERVVSLGQSPREIRRPVMPMALMTDRTTPGLEFTVSRDRQVTRERWMPSPRVRERVQPRDSANAIMTLPLTPPIRLKRRRLWAA